MFPRSFFLLLPGAVARTSGGSPTTSDARVVANQMGGNGGLACNDVNAPQGCTQIWRVGTAAANLCIGDDGCISFNEAAQIVQQIADECSPNGLSGGLFDWGDPAYHLDLYHTTCRPERDSTPANRCTDTAAGIYYYLLAALQLLLVGLGGVVGGLLAGLNLFLRCVELPLHSIAQILEFERAEKFKAAFVNTIMSTARPSMLSFRGKE
ncbi:hypothetical protein B0H14DRAFT_3161355 [Mycena olivaceomarginata]|nr:hypothetical protein B0H14DRAFT_3161355 [Mycena olivaceomarginata]